MPNAEGIQAALEYAQELLNECTRNPIRRNERAIERSAPEQCE